jgi:hypothetical protein
MHFHILLCKCLKFLCQMKYKKIKLRALEWRKTIQKQPFLLQAFYIYSAWDNCGGENMLFAGVCVHRLSLANLDTNFDRDSVSYLDWWTMSLVFTTCYCLPYFNLIFQTNVMVWCCSHKFNYTWTLHLTKLSSNSLHYPQHWTFMVFLRFIQGSSISFIISGLLCWIIWFRSISTHMYT